MRIKVLLYGYAHVLSVFGRERTIVNICHRFVTTFLIPIVIYFHCFSFINCIIEVACDAKTTSLLFWCGVSAGIVLIILNTGSIMARKGPKVLLGFEDECITEKHKSLMNFTTNKIGGKPVNCI